MHKKLKIEEGLSGLHHKIHIEVWFRVDGVTVARLQTRWLGETRRAKVHSEAEEERAECEDEAGTREHLADWLGDQVREQRKYNSHVRALHSEENAS